VARAATPTGTGTAAATTARPATATSGTLALTGSSSRELAAIGALALVIGAALVRATRSDGPERAA
jgi:hypothetical protein